MWRPDKESEWQEAWIDPVGIAQQAQQQTWKERLAPASDPLLLACLKVAEQERQQRPPQAQQQKRREALAPASDSPLLAFLKFAEQERQQRPPQGSLPGLQAANSWDQFDFDGMQVSIIRLGPSGVSCASTFHNTACQEAATACCHTPQIVLASKFTQWCLFV